MISEYQVDRRWQDNDNLRNFVGRPGSGSGGLPDYKLDLKSDTDKITLSVSSEFYWQVRPGESKIQVAFSGGPAFLRTYKILKILN